jgi:hypothetical protein
MWIRSMPLPARDFRGFRVGREIPVDPSLHFSARLRQGVTEGLAEAAMETIQIPGERGAGEQKPLL